MLITYFLIYCTLNIASWLDGVKRNKPLLKRLYLFFLVCFILFASFKNVNLVADAQTYIYALEDKEFILEPSFHFIKFIVNKVFGSNPLFLFLIYSLIAIPIKGKAILQISLLPLFSLLIWFSDLYLVQELTQIRVGVAGSIFLLSIPSLYERNLKKYLWLTVCATFFHISAILMLLLWFLSNNKINTKVWFILVIGSLVWAYLKIDLFGLLRFIPISGINEKYEAYKIIMEENDQSTFSPLVLAKYVITLFIMLRIHLIEKHNKYFILMLKIMLISIITRFLFATNTSVAFRISEFFGVIEITLIPCLYYVVKNHIIKYGIITSIALCFMSIRIFSNKLINF